MVEEGEDHLFLSQGDAFALTGPGNPFVSPCLDRSLVSGVRKETIVSSIVTTLRLEGQAQPGVQP